MEVEVRVRTCEENRRITQQKPITTIKMKDATKYKTIYCMICRIGCRRSERFGYRDTASSSHEFPMESRAKVEPGSGKQSVHTHFPKDLKCEICLKTKITRASCRRRANAVVPRAENFGDLITADDKVLSEGCETRNNHRYAVEAQDLTTQQLQSYPCKTKSSQETQKSLVKFLEPNRKPKVIYTDNSFGIWQSL